MYAKLRKLLRTVSCDNKNRIKLEITTAFYTTSSNLQRHNTRYRNSQQMQEQPIRRQVTMSNRSNQDQYRCRIFESRVFPLKGKIDGSYYQPGDVVTILSYDDATTNTSPDVARIGLIVGRIDTDNNNENTHFKKSNCDDHTIDNMDDTNDKGLLPDKSSSVICEKKQQENFNIVTSTSVPVRPRKRKRNQQQQLWNVCVHNQNKESLIVQNINSDKSRIEMIPHHNDTTTISNDTNNSTNAVLTFDQFHILFGYWSEHLIRSPVFDVVITSTTDDFRRIASKYSYISNNSCCIVEIGCSTGETSRLLWQRLLVQSQQQQQQQQQHQNKNHNHNQSFCWIGFDTSKQMIDTMQQEINSTNDDKYNSIHRSCICMNPLSNPGAAIDYIQCEINKATGISIASTGSDINDDGSCRKLQPTIIYIDIGGNRDEYSVLQMIQWIKNTNATMWSDSVQLIVIKSEQVVSTLLMEDIRNNKEIVHPDVDMRSGIVSNGTAWLQNRLEQLHSLNNDTNNTNTKSNTTTTTTATMVLATTVQPLIDDSPTESLRMNAPIVSDTTSTTAICKTVSSTSYIMNSFFPKHPLQAPKRYYKKASNNDTCKNNIDDSEGILICRYHNYHKDGCKRHKDPNCTCPYDHEHCHLCLQYGHTALQCTQPRQ